MITTADLVGASIFLGVVIGVFLLSYVYNLIALIIVSNSDERKKKFIVEQKLGQEYVEYKNRLREERRKAWRVIWK